MLIGNAVKFEPSKQTCWKECQTSTAKLHLADVENKYWIDHHSTTRKQCQTPPLKWCKMHQSHYLLIQAPVPSQLLRYDIVSMSRYDVHFNFHFQWESNVISMLRSIIFHHISMSFFVTMPKWNIILRDYLYLLFQFPATRIYNKCCWKKRYW